jgi:uncharacterized membrane protein YgaE (UPF0421/DUF939 family)
MNSQTILFALQLPIRAAVSAGLAVAFAQILHLQYPLYALIGAVIVTDLSPLQTRQLGLQRLAGTLLGSTVGALLCHFVPTGPVTIGIGILAAMFLSDILHLKGAAKVTGYVCGIIMLEHQGHQWTYGFYRLMETVLGICASLLVSSAPKLLSSKTSGQNSGGQTGSNPSNLSTKEDTNE